MKARKVHSARPASSPVTRTTGRIEFTPQRVLAGICFHLCDEGLVKSITPESIRHTEQRMTRERLELWMAREHWESMDHRERLNWLMAESHTVMTLEPGGVATLHRNDDEK